MNIGLSSNGKVLNEELFAAYEKSGITHMEISPKMLEFCDIDLGTLKKYADTYGVKLWSFHLPFMPFSRIDISSTDKNIRSSTVSCLCDLMKKAADAGISKYVVHPSGEPIPDEEREEKLLCAGESLDMLAEAAAKCGGIVAVEDLPRTCLGHDSAEIKRLISVNDKLRVCFDTNHLLCESNFDFIKNLGDKIITVHVSDYDSVNERHWLPSEGKIDWHKLYDNLVQCGYDGPWLYEVEFVCPSTIKRSRDLNCDDFVRNAKEIFAKQEITVIK